MRETPPTALDFDLEDENGVVETVSIPKGGGGGGSGLTTAQVNDLIDEHRDVEDAHHVKTPPGTGSGGLDQDAVDARVRAGVEPTGQRPATPTRYPALSCRCPLLGHGAR